MLAGLANAKGLTFTNELPKDSTLQFLDLNLTLLSDHVCCAYIPRGKKELLQYDSAHSKTVKRGIALLCLESALRKSCVHMMQASFRNQLERLLRAGYPQSVLNSVIESLLQKLKASTANVKAHSKERERVKPEVVPYVHRLSHNLKKVATRYGIPVVFSAPNKLAQLCPRITRDGPRGCQKQHTNPVRSCIEGVVYEIPLDCGRSYIGQTGRCINDRLREHANSIGKCDNAHLPAHCKACHCEPRFKQVSILGKSGDKTSRELLEAYFIKKKGSDCVSDTSITLYSAEMCFLEKMLS